MSVGLRHLLIGLAVCAVLHVASRNTREITAARPGIPVATEGSFERDGHHPGEALPHAAKLRTWGSWSGSDDNKGSIILGPFLAPRVLRFAVSGYPGKAGNTLRVELADGSESLVIKTADAGERWEIVDFELPLSWRDRAVRIIGQDTSKGSGGWLGLTEPVHGGRSDGNNALLQTLAAFAINGLLLGIVYCAAAQWLSRGGPISRLSALPPHWIPLGAGAMVALCAYLAFWAYFINALFGVIVSWTVVGAAFLRLARDRRARRGSNRLEANGGLTTLGEPASDSLREVATVLKLMLSIGGFYLALLHLFPTQHDFYTLAANRYREALPGDNVLSHVTAERLFASESLKNPIDEWLSSDRPPLQAGWQLLTWPAAKVLGLDRRTASGTSAIWFQLLWLAAAYGLLRSFAIERHRAAGWVATLALCGFFLQNTTYTWPKLSAGAFACGTFALLLLPDRASVGSVPASGRRPNLARATNALWAGIFAALAWLSHGGVAFSFLALLPLLAWQGRGGQWRAWLPGAVAVVILISPWLAYQTFYDPPANRLFKWHLAGQAEKDARGTIETVRDSYEKIGWRTAWSNKVSNLHAQVFGDWRHLVDVSGGTATDRRSQEFFHTGRALTWWPLLALFAVVTTRRHVFTPERDFLVLGCWLLLTVLAWCLLMFGEYQAVIHHGSYALLMGLFVLFSLIIERSGRGWLAAITLLQAITLGTTWAIANSAVRGPATGVYVVIGFAVWLAWFVARAFWPARREESSVALEESSPNQGRGALTTAFEPAALVERDLAPAPRQQSSPEAEPRITPKAHVSPSWTESLRAWWQNPRITFWALAAVALALFLRKPHALHTPQLWAEDGSIFLMQADLHGSSALTIPYMGYLHTLPRLIAWLAPRFLDPAWWPAFYNGVSFLIWLAVLARLFTARFDLPGKPWIAFAIIAVPHTGEVFFNITNLQWLTAFVLIQQVLIRPPKTTAERVSDLGILALVTLTGPFGVAFLPLFAWRWWRDRRSDNVAAFAVVLFAAAIQVWFVFRTGPRFEFQSEPLQLWNILVILARRLAVWPLFNTDIALALPKGLVASLGLTIIVTLLGWSLRRHPRRESRAVVVAAFVLITVAGVYRTRPDTWTADNFDYGDRYFYIPRVLLAWLLIWEFDTVPRAIANAARVLCVVVLLSHLRSYTMRAPVDYHWADHVTPIRQGVRADISTLPEGWTLEYRGRPEKR